jgi:hypothetical protein
MSDINLIKLLKSKLDTLAEDAAFEEALKETGIFEETESLFEASPLLSQFGRDPEGIKLAKYLHNVLHISDRAKMVPYKHHKHPKETNLELYDFKSHYDNFIVIHGPNGWAAVRPKQEWLEPRLASGVPFDPRKQSKFDKQPYVMYASVKNHDDVIIHEFQATRGGRYGALEKKDPKTGERLVNIADEMKKYVGFGKPDEMKIYRLEVREDPALAKVSDPQFSGRRSRTLGAAGPSIQRYKLKARARNQEGNVESKVDSLFDRTFKAAPLVMKAVAVKLYQEKGDTTEKYDDYAADLNSEEFKKAWKDTLDEVLGSQHLAAPFAKDLELYRIYRPNDKSSTSDLILKLYDSPPFWVVTRSGAAIPQEEIKKLILNNKLDSKYSSLAFRKDANAQSAADHLNAALGTQEYTVQKVSLSGKLLMMVMKQMKEELYKKVTV